MATRDEAKQRVSRLFGNLELGARPRHLAKIKNVKNLTEFESPKHSDISVSVEGLQTESCVTETRGKISKDPTVDEPNKHRGRADSDLGELELLSPDKSTKEIKSGSSKRSSRNLVKEKDENKNTQVKAKELKSERNLSDHSVREEISVDRKNRCKNKEDSVRRRYRGDKSDLLNTEPCYSNKNGVKDSANNVDQCLHAREAVTVSEFFENKNSEKFGGFSKAQRPAKGQNKQSSDTVQSLKTPRVTRKLFSKEKQGRNIQCTDFIDAHESTTEYELKQPECDLKSVINRKVTDTNVSTQKVRGSCRESDRTASSHKQFDQCITDTKSSGNRDGAKTLESKKTTQKRLRQRAVPIRDRASSADSHDSKDKQKRSKRPGGKNRKSENVSDCVESLKKVVLDTELHTSKSGDVKTIRKSRKGTKNIGDAISQQRHSPLGAETENLDCSLVTIRGADLDLSPVAAVSEVDLNFDLLSEEFSDKLKMDIKMNNETSAACTSTSNKITPSDRSTTTSSAPSNITSSAPINMTSSAPINMTSSAPSAIGRGRGRGHRPLLNRPGKCVIGKESKIVSPNVVKRKEVDAEVPTSRRFCNASRTPVKVFKQKENLNKAHVPRAISSGRFSSDQRINFNLKESENLKKNLPDQSYSINRVNSELQEKVDFEHSIDPASYQNIPTTSYQNIPYSYQNIQPRRHQHTPSPVHPRNFQPECPQSLSLGSDHQYFQPSPPESPKDFTVFLPPYYSGQEQRENEPLRDGRLDHLDQRNQLQYDQDQMPIRYDIEAEPAHWQTQNCRVEAEPAHWLTQNSRVEAEPAHWQSQNSRVEAEPAHWQSQNSRVRAYDSAQTWDRQDRDEEIRYSNEHQSLGGNLIRGQNQGQTQEPVHSIYGQQDIPPHLFSDSGTLNPNTINITPSPSPPDEIVFKRPVFPRDMWSHHNASVGQAGPTRIVHETSLDDSRMRSTRPGIQPSNHWPGGFNEKFQGSVPAYGHGRGRPRMDYYPALQQRLPIHGASSSQENNVCSYDFVDNRSDDRMYPRRIEINNFTHYAVDERTENAEETCKNIDNPVAKYTIEHNAELTVSPSIDPTSFVSSCRETSETNNEQNQTPGNKAGYVPESRNYALKDTDIVVSMKYDDSKLVHPDEQIRSDSSARSDLEGVVSDEMSIDKGGIKKTRPFNSVQSPPKDRDLTLAMQCTSKYSFTSEDSSGDEVDDTCCFASSEGSESDSRAYHSAKEFNSPLLRSPGRLLTQYSEPSRTRSIASNRQLNLEDDNLPITGNSSLALASIKEDYDDAVQSPAPPPGFTGEDRNVIKGSGMEKSAPPGFEAVPYIHPISTTTTTDTHHDVCNKRSFDGSERSKSANTTSSRYRPFTAGQFVTLAGKTPPTQKLITSKAGSCPTPSTSNTLQGSWSRSRSTRDTPLPRQPVVHPSRVNIKTPPPPVWRHYDTNFPCLNAAGIQSNILSSTDQGKARSVQTEGDFPWQPPAHGQRFLYKSHEKPNREGFKDYNYLGTNTSPNCSSSSESINLLDASPKSDWRMTYRPQLDCSNIPYIDSHCHIDFIIKRSRYVGNWSSYQEEHAETFMRNYAGCVTNFCDPTTYKPNGSWKSILAEDKVWAAFGCHPKSVRCFTPEKEIFLRHMMNYPKVVALGEIGLDYSSNFEDQKDLQKEAFIKQLEIATHYQKPLVIHCREAEKDCLEIMKRYVPHDYKIHRHCFTENFATAAPWLDYFTNCFLGLTPLVTYRRAKQVHEVARMVPLNRLLLETDSPYFVPRDVSKSQMPLNSPGMAICVADEVARLRDISMDEVLRYARSNTESMYGV